MANDVIITPASGRIQFIKDTGQALLPYNIDLSSGSGLIIDSAFTSSIGIKAPNIADLSGSNTFLGSNTFNGATTINGNLSVFGATNIFSASNIYITSSNLTVTDNILLMNALTPYQRYAGIQMYDSGSGTLSHLLWDGQGDYFFLSGSGINSKIIGGPDGQGNLSSGYIPKTTGVNILGDSTIYDTGAGIGISTTSPNAKLGVFGGSLSTVSGSSSIIASFSTINSNSSYLRIIESRFATGSGWDTARTRIQKTTDVTDQAYIEFNPSGSQYGLAFGTGIASEKVRIDSSGNVGIGTTNPLQKLHVSGSSRIDGICGFGINPSSWSTGIYGVEIGGAGNSIWANGNSYLELVNNSYFNSGWKYANNAASSRYELGLGIHYWLTATSGTANNALTWSERMRLTNSGNLGIGTSVPTSSLHIKPNTISADLLILERYASQAKLIYAYESGADGFLEIRNGNDGIVSKLSGYASTPTYFLSSVGIGETNPLAKLVVSNGSSENIEFSPGNVTYNGGIIEYINRNSVTTRPDFSFFLSSAGGGAFKFYTGGANERLRITATGNVGIGTTSPTSKLTVATTVATSSVFSVQGTNGTLFNVIDDLSDSLLSVNNSAGLPVLEVFADDRLVAGQYNQNDFVVVNNKVGIGTNNPSAKLTVTSSVSTPSAVFLGGNVGIGTTSPAAGVTLTVASSSRITEGASSTGVLQFGLADTFVGYSASLFNIRTWDGVGYFEALRTNGASRFTLLAPTTGSVGIGTTSTSAKVTIQAIGSGNDLGISNANLPLYVKTYGGTSTNVRNMFVGHLYTASDTDFSTSQITLISANNLAAQSVAIALTSNNALAFYTNGGNPAADSLVGTERLRINSSGNVGIGTNNPAYLLDVSGSSRHGYRSADNHYFTGSINISGSLNATSSWAVNSVTASRANSLDPSNSYTVNGLTANYVEVTGLATIPTTGIYRPATKTLGLSADGVLVFKISNLASPATSSIETGNFIVQSGNVGIATTNPATRLDVVGQNAGLPATSGATQSTSSILRLRNGNSNLVLDIGGYGGNGNWFQSTNRNDLSLNYPILLNPNGGNVGIGTDYPDTKLDVAGAVTMPVIKQSTTLYAGTDITDDNSTRTVYFNITDGGYSPSKYFKIARIKITGNYQNVSLNGYFTVTNSTGLHVGSERKVEFDFIAYAHTNPGAPQVTYLKRGPDTTTVLVYAVPNGGGAGTTYYDVYLRSGWYNDTNGELAIRVGYSSAVTVWQSGLDSGTSAPTDTLVNPNSNYSFDTTGNIGIGTTSPATTLNVSGSTRISAGELQIEGNNAALRLYRTTGINYLDWASGQDFYLGTVTSIGGAGRSNKMVILDGGSVGIGTTSPAYKLDLYDTGPSSAMMSLRSSGSGNAIIYLDAANGDLIGSDYCYMGQEDATLNFVINTGGNAGNIHLQPKSGTSNGILFVSGSTRFGLVSTHAHQFTGSVNISPTLNVGGVTYNDSIDIDKFEYFTLQPYIEAGNFPSNVLSTGGGTDPTFTTLTGSDCPFGKVAYNAGYYEAIGGEYIPVNPGETLYGEIWAYRTSGATGTAGQFYCGVARYDKDKNPIATNLGLTYFVAGGVTIPTSSVWTMYSGTTTLPTTHTPFGGSDGGPVRYVRPYIIVNYTAGTIPTYWGAFKIRKQQLTRDTGNITISGSVGIGTTSPNRKLQIDAGTGGPALRLTNTNSNSGIEILTATSTYSWLLGAQYNINGAFEITPSTAVGGTTFSTPTAVFLQTGNVGIGTTSPVAKLQVNGNVSGSSFTSSVSNAVGFLGTSSWAVNVTGTAGGETLSTVTSRGNSTGAQIIVATAVGQAMYVGRQAGAGYSYGSAGIFTALSDNPTGSLNSFFQGFISSSTSSPGGINTYTVRADGLIYTTFNSATGIANNSFNVGKTILGALHIANGSGTTGNNNQAAITFQGSSTSEAQAGIYVSNNSATGTAMAFATTDNYGSGPQIFMTAINNGTVNFPRNNVGVNVASPLFNLSVNSTFNAGGPFVLSGSANSTTYFDQNAGAYQHTPGAMIRVDSAASSSAHAPATLVLYNRNGSNNTSAKLVFANNETNAANANPVATAAITSEKVSGTAGSWAYGNLKFLVKNSSLYTDAAIIDANGNFGVGVLSNLQPIGVGSTSATTLGLLRTGVQAIDGNIGPSINFYLSQTSGSTSLTGDTNLARITANPIDGWGGRMLFFTKAADANNVTAPTEKMRISEQGYVGIGTGSFVYGAANRGLLEIYGSTDSLIGLKNSTANAYIQKTGNDFYLNNGGAGTIYIQNNGNNRLVVDSNGNVGIGTTIPSQLVEAYKSSNSDIVYQVTNPNSGTSATAQFFASNGTTRSQFFHTGTSYTGIGVTNYTGLGGIYNGSTGISLAAGGASGIILFGTGTSQSERMRITNTGDVGIGTTSPTSRLTVATTVATSSVFSVKGTNGTLFNVIDDLSDSLLSVNNSAGLPVLEVFADDRLVAGQYNQNDFVVVNNKVGIGTNNPSAKLTVTSSVSTPSAVFLGGNVGIGTSSPAYILDVTPNTSTVRLGRLLTGAWPAGNTYAFFGNTSLDHTGGANYALLQYTDGTTFLNAAAGTPIYFRIANSSKMILDSNGNVGIGNTTPGQKLSVQGEISKYTVTGIDSTFDNFIKYGYFGDLQSGATNTNRWIGFDASITAGGAVSNVLRARAFGGGNNNNAPVNIVDFRGDQTTYFYGNVGIGSSSPTVKLAVSDGTTVAQINPSSNVAYFGTVNNYPIAFSVNSQEVVRIDTSGNLGIGTTVPTNFLNSNTTYFRPSGSGEFLTVYSATSEAVINLITSGSGNDFPVGGMYFTRQRGQGDAHYQIAAIKALQDGTSTTLAGGKLYFYTKVDGAGTPFENPALVIKSNSYVGIGTTAPSEVLDVRGNIKLGATNSGSFIYYLKDIEGTIVKTQRSDTTQEGLFRSDGWGNFTFNKSIGVGYSIGAGPITGNIYASGNVGIGTNTSSAKLSVNSSGSLAAGSVVFRVEGTSGSLFSVDDTLSGSLMSVNDISGLPILEVFSDNKVVMGTFNANTLVVTGSRVGIGSASPTQLLDVNGDAKITRLGISIAPSNRLHVNGDGTNPAIRIDNGALVTGVASNSKNTFQGYLPVAFGTSTYYIRLWT